MEAIELANHLHHCSQSDSLYGRRVSGLISMLTDGSLIVTGFLAGGAFASLRHSRLGDKFLLDLQSGLVS